MGNQASTETKKIRIRTLHHAKSGLYAAISPDMKNLIVHGRTVDELIKKVPDVIRELLEAEGFKSVEVDWIDDAEMQIPPGFVLENASFDARLSYSR